MTVKRNSRINTITKRLGIPLDISKGIEEAEVGIIVSGFFTSDGVDEVGDIITREATENAIPKYREWGNIRYMHMPKPVAKVLGIGKDDGLKWNEVKIHVLDPEAVFQVRNGLLKALSVGIIIWSWDDIEILDDGTWVINQYDLVVISLVDHPANYDARLFLDDDKAVPITNEIRQLVNTEGFAMVAKALGAVSPVELEEFDMADLTETNLPEEEILEETEEVLTEELSLESEESEEEEVLTEELIMDEEESEEEEVLTEELALEADEEEEVLTEELDMGEEETIEAVTDDTLTLSVDDEDVEEIFTEETQLLNLSVSGLRSLIEETVKGLLNTMQEVTPEVPEEEQVETELSADEDEPSDDESTLAERLEELVEENKLLQTENSELKEVQQRKGMIHSDTPIHETLEEMENEEEGSDLLKDAIKKHVSQPVTGVMTIRSR